MAEGKEDKKKEEVEWDKKKIVMFTAVFFVLCIFGLLFINFNFQAPGKKLVQEKNMKSTSPQVSVKKTVQDQINNLKQEAGNLDLVDVATSSPQVQKVINDLKALKDYPNNQLKQTCMDVCQKL